MFFLDLTKAEISEYKVRLKSCAKMYYTTSLFFIIINISNFKTVCSKTLTDLPLINSKYLDKFLFYFHLDFYSLPVFHTFFTEHSIIQQIVFSGTLKNRIVPPLTRNADLVHTSIFVITNTPENCTSFPAFVETLWNIHLSSDTLSYVFMEENPSFVTGCSGDSEDDAEQSFQSFGHTPALKVLIPLNANNEIRSVQIMCKGYCSSTTEELFPIYEFPTLQNKSTLMGYHKSNFRLSPNKAIPSFIAYTPYNFEMESETKDFLCNRPYHKREYWRLAEGRYCWPKQMQAIQLAIVHNFTISPWEGGENFNRS